MKVKKLSTKSSESHLVCFMSNVTRYKATHESATGSATFAETRIQIYRFALVWHEEVWELELIKFSQICHKA